MSVGGALPTHRPLRRIPVRSHPALHAAPVALRPFPSHRHASVPYASRFLFRSASISSRPSCQRSVPPPRIEYLGVLRPACVRTPRSSSVRTRAGSPNCCQKMFRRSGRDRTPDRSTVHRGTSTAWEPAPDNANLTPAIEHRSRSCIAQRLMVHAFPCPGRAEKARESRLLTRSTPFSGPCA